MQVCKNKANSLIVNSSLKTIFSMQIPNQRVGINLYVVFVNVDFFYYPFQTNVKNASKAWDWFVHASQIAPN